MANDFQQGRQDHSMGKNRQSFQKIVTGKVDTTNNAKE